MPTPSFLCPQGIKAVLAESYERIHRSNLVGMGIIPLEYLPGDTAESLGLTGRECYTIVIPETLTPKMNVDIQVCPVADATTLQSTPWLIVRDADGAALSPRTRLMLIL